VDGADAPLDVADVGVLQPAANPTFPVHWAAVVADPPDMLLAAVVGDCRFKVFVVAA